MNAHVVQGRRIPYHLQVPAKALLDTNGNTDSVELEMVTGRYFAFFYARPELGRLLEEADDQVGGAGRVCVLSYPASQDYFGGDPHIINRAIRIAGVPLRVVGIARPDFVGAELQQRYDVWVPTALSSVLTPIPRETGNYYWLLDARPPPTRHLDRRSDCALAGCEPAQRNKPGSKGTTDIYRLADASRGFDR